MALPENRRQLDGQCVAALSAAYGIFGAHENDKLTDESALAGLADQIDNVVGHIFTPALAAACRQYAQTLRASNTLVTSWRQLAEWVDRVFGLVRYSIYGLHEHSIQHEIFALGEDLERVLKAAAPAVLPPAEEIAAARILVVDDSRIVRQIVATQLTKAGHEVGTADTFAACQNLLKTFSPTLVLTDVVLPDASGDDLCAAIKAQSQRLIPVVLMSNLPEHELAERAKAAGADGYVSKRHGVEKLVAMLNGILSELVY
jgi:CheY-like chemotaxis protein